MDEQERLPFRDVFNLTRRLNTREKIYYVTAAVFVMVLWSIIALFLLMAFGISLRDQGGDAESFWSTRPAWQFLLYGIVIGPLIEEIVFRFAPIRITQVLFRSHTVRRRCAVFFVIIASSFVFGYLHGGMPFVFIQGVQGLILSWLFLKTNRSLLSIWAAHGAYNGLWFGILYFSIWLAKELEPFVFPQLF